MFPFSGSWRIAAAFGEPRKERRHEAWDIVTDPREGARIVAPGSGLTPGAKYYDIGVEL